jgi:hypothetical protein
MFRAPLDVHETPPPQSAKKPKQKVMVSASRFASASSNPGKGAAAKHK